MELSSLASRLTGQPMFQVTEKVKQLEAQGKNILHLEVGDPQFRNPDSVVEAAYEAMKQGKTHYVSSMGINELRDAICDDTEETYGFRPTREQVLISPANAIIYWLMSCVLDRGEGVIYPNPGFPTYGLVSQLVGAVTNNVVDKKLFIINSPNNPTGRMADQTTIKVIYKVCQELDIYLLSDETYSKLTYEEKHYSPAVYDHCKERVVILNSFSKSYSMTGWRLGYAIAPEPLAKKMGLMLDTVISCVPPFIQWAGIQALKEKNYTKLMVEILKRNRDLIVKGLNSLPGVHCDLPDGAFYAFPDIRGTGMTSQEFADKMLEAGVALLPGTNFGSNGEGYVRLSYATNEKVITEAIQRMGYYLGENGVK